MEGKICKFLKVWGKICQINLMEAKFSKKKLRKKNTIKPKLYLFDTGRIFFEGGIAKK